MIAEQDPALRAERIEEIDNGAELTKAETYQLCKSIAEQDFYGWLTHNSFEVSFLDGNVYLYFQGESIGAASFDFKYKNLSNIQIDARIYNRLTLQLC